MNTPRTIGALAAAFTGMLAFSACLPSDDSAADDDAVTSTVTTTEVASEEPSTEESIKQSDKDSLQASSPAPPPTPAPQPVEPVDQGNFNGQAVNICQVGDGWGISELSTNTNTTCGFAQNVMGALVSGIEPGEDIRDYVPKTVTATSPATGETYEMYCADNGVGIITCKGGNNAEVIML